MVGNTLRLVHMCLENAGGDNLYLYSHIGSGISRLWYILRKYTLKDAQY